MLPNILNVPISKLTLLKENPRKITKEQFEKLCKNIQNDPNYFNLRPVLVNAIDGNFTVYAGNQRIRAAKKLGWKEVPCIIETDLDAETIKKRIILDNIHHGEFDWDMLSAKYDALELLDLGFTDTTLQLSCYVPESAMGNESIIDKNEVCEKCGQKIKRAQK